MKQYRVSSNIVSSTYSGLSAGPGASSCPYASCIDEYYLWALVLSVPTVPFWRYGYGTFEVPLAVPLTFVYVIVKVISLIYEDRVFDFRPVITGLLMILLLWSTASVLWSSSPGFAVRRLITTAYQLLFVVVTLNLCALKFSTLFQTGRIWPLMTCIPVLVGFYGFITTTDPIYYQFSYEYPREMGDRNSDTFMILTGIPFALAMVLDKSSHPTWKWLGIVATSAPAAAIFYSLSRGNLVIMISIIVIITFTDFVIRRGRPTSVPIIAAICAGALAFSWAIAPDSPTKTAEKLAKRFEDVDRDNRWAYLVAAWELAGRHPITGVGLNNFPKEFQTTEVGRYVFGEEEIYPASHNSFLGALAELGIPGLILFCAVVFWPVSHLIYLIAFQFHDPDPRVIPLFLGALGVSLVLITGILAYDFANSFFFWVVFVFEGLVVLGLDRELRGQSERAA